MGKPELKDSGILATTVDIFSHENLKRCRAPNFSGKVSQGLVPLPCLPPTVFGPCCCRVLSPQKNPKGITGSYIWYQDVGSVVLTGSKSQYLWWLSNNLLNSEVFSSVFVFTLFSLVGLCFFFQCPLTLHYALIISLTPQRSPSWGPWWCSSSDGRSSLHPTQIILFLMSPDFNFT